METKEFIARLRTHKNPEKSAAMERYMRDQFPFLGLQAAERRKLSRPFIQAAIREAKERTQNIETSVVDWLLLFTLWAQPEREFQLIGIDYLKALQDDLVLADLPSLRELVLSKSWWDTVDFLAKNIGAIVKKEPHLSEEMIQWSLAGNLWIRRVAILHQLSFKESTRSDLLQEILLNNVQDEAFFIQKAIGWALREYAKSDEQWVRNFVTTHKNSLSALSSREASKYLK